MENKTTENRIEGRENLNEEMKSVDLLLERIKQQKEIDTHVPQQWKLLQSRIHKEERYKHLYFWMRDVAAILFLPVLLLTGFLFSKLNLIVNEEVAQIEIVSDYGVKTKIQLPDGSKVWLNSGSTLSYPERFTAAHREVFLSGEAFFKVESDPEHRFDVKTHDNICVSAYGTEFNVEAFDGDNEVKATLAKGAIAMEQGTSLLKTTLSPGEQAVYVRDKAQMHKEKVNLMVETGWKDGKIVFRRTKMETVVRRLSRKFNVKIDIKDDEILNYEYSGTFVNESLETILDLLARTSPISYEIIKPSQQNNLEFTQKIIEIKLRD